MHAPPPIISNHRLARLALWLLAVLAWFVLGDSHHQRRAGVTFAKIERAVRDLIVIRAAQVLGPRRTKPRRHHGRKPPRISQRAVGGSWLRRRLRIRGDIVARAAKLISAIRNWRALAAQLARRRAAGLTRLAAAWLAVAGAAPALVPAPAAPCAADTS